MTEIEYHTLKIVSVIQFHYIQVRIWATGLQLFGIQLVFVVIVLLCLTERKILVPDTCERFPLCPAVGLQVVVASGTSGWWMWFKPKSQGDGC